MRQILHIDMNSYFATVEQQANPKLRGKPIAVMGSTAKRTIIVAASIEAKKYGVKTATKIEDAMQLCPDLILVNGEPRKYAHVTKKFIEIFEDYTDNVEIFSIDEAFLDVTATAKLYKKTKHKGQKTKNVVIPSGVEESRKLNNEILNQAQGDERMFIGAINIALEIKKRIRDEIGSYISCSAGVSYNKFLAKTGSDLKKPDGLVVITPNPHPSVIPIKGKRTERSLRGHSDSRMSQDGNEGDVQIFTTDEVLLKLPLSEYCGIGKRIYQRLGFLGIEDTEQLRNYSNVLLAKEFGVAVGGKLKRMANGIDSSPVISWHDRVAAKSYGHSRTLNKNVTSREEIKKHLLLLSEKVAARMRKDGMMGREIGVWIRFGDFTGTGQRHRSGRWTHDGVEIYESAIDILSRLNIKAPVRAIGVYVSQVENKQNLPSSFLESDKINDRILAAMDAANSRFGETVVTRARLAGTKMKEVVSGMGRDKF